MGGETKSACGAVLSRCTGMWAKAPTLLEGPQFGAVAGWMVFRGEVRHWGGGVVFWRRGRWEEYGSRVLSPVVPGWR
jgi:hypothetical protein